MSLAPAVIAAERLRKVYRVYERPGDRLLERLLGRPRHREIPALDDVSFELRRGDSLGIVGENGAGKSTLLKILSGVTEATSGGLSVEGSLASLLELGMGFHPELTGRQNIRLSAAMMGLGEREVVRKTPDVAAFSELGDFLDRPVKTYSTGMAMRLGFAIAVQVEPEILIIDEALAVGDGYFQKKCMNRLLELRRSGRTLLFCSHAMYYVTAFCERALWLRRGKMEAFGPVDDVVRRYESFLATKGASLAEPGAYEPATAGAGPARITAVRLRGFEDGQPAHCRSGEPWALEIEWTAEGAEVATHLGVGLNASAGHEVAAFATHRAGLPPRRGPGPHRATLEIAELPLVKGDFTLYVFLLDEEGLHVYDQRILSDAFSVASDGYEFGVVRLPHRWSFGAASGLRG